MGLCAPNMVVGHSLERECVRVPLRSITASVIQRSSCSLMRQLVYISMILLNYCAYIESICSISSRRETDREAVKKQLKKLVHIYIIDVFLAIIQHTIQCCLFRTRNRQRIRALDLDPGLGVGAVEARQGRLPLVGTLVALGAV